MIYYTPHISLLEICKQRVQYQDFSVDLIEDIWLTLDVIRLNRA